MKLPPYRLQPVLNKREKAKQEAERVLGEAQKALALEKEKEAECERAIELAIQKKEDFKAEMNQKMMEGTLDVEKIKMHKNYLKSLDFEIEQARQRLEEQKVVVQQAEQVVEEKRMVLIDATKEFQAIEKHKENWIKQLKKEMEEAEQKEQEEIGNVLYVQRKQRDS